MSISPDGLSQYGGAPVDGPIAFGKRFFVRPATGSDSNRGRKPTQALASLSQAQSLATASAGDVVYFISEGNSATNSSWRPTSAFTWSKDHTHLIGATAPIMFSQRARISTSTVSLTPMVTISANGCIWKNIQLFHGVTADQLGLICCSVTGDRNYFENVHFAGGGISTIADDAGMRSLKLSGASENVFNNCVIGLDTVDRATTANAELEFDNGSQSDGCARNVFDRCVLTTYGSGAHAMVIVDADGIDRYALFRDCTFINAIQSGTTALTECFSCTANSSPGGAIILQNPLSYGCGPWEADVETGRVVLLGHPTPASTDGSGLAGAPESP